MRLERANRFERPAAVEPPAAPRGLSSWVSAFGLDAHPGSTDMQASAENVRALAQMAPWAALSHAIAIVATLLGPALSGSDTSFVAIAGLSAALILVDTLFNFGLRRRGSIVARPGNTPWLASAYAMATGLIGAGLLLASRGSASDVHLFALAGAGLATVLMMGPVPAAAILFLVPSLGAIGWLAHDTASGLLLAISALLCALSLLSVARRRQQMVRRRMEANRDTRKASDLLAEFEENRRGWFWETDTRGHLTYISSQLAEALGCAASALIGVAFTSLVMNEDGSDLAEGVRAAERTLGFHLSTRLAFSDIPVRAACEGEARWWSLCGRPAFDEFQNFLGFRGSGTDLTEMRRSEAEVNRLARYDALTGLPNRLLMRQTLDASIRDIGDRHKPCALFLLDLDRFKNVNDTLGHPVGDVLLRQVAERLLSVIGDAGRCGRVGGDEFNVVMPGISDRGRLAQLAHAVIEKVSAPYMIEGAHVSIGASIGVAVAPDDGATADSLVRNADLALYAAKAAGKGVHRFYEHEMHANAKDRRQIELDLRKAITEGGFHLAYQPVVHAKSEKVTGFEALIRWNHPTRGPVSPTLFVPIAEEIGLIPQIGEWVLRTACREAALWPDDIRVAVNISPIQFASPALPSIVMSAIAAAQLPAERLELEITEGVFLSGGEATDLMFARLKAVGVRFALDDFGTGYSSLGYLKKAPFNKIKIDQSFVRGAAIPGNRNAAIIKAIVSLAESLDMETTAEGAETHDELDLIRSLGCSHIQGYIFGKPMPASEARELVGGGAMVIANGFLTSRSPRVAVLRSATLHHPGGRMPVRLRNISSTGAMLEGGSMLRGGELVRLEFADGTLHSGVIRWTQDGRIGLIFDLPFDMDQIAMRPRLASAKVAARN